MEEIATGQGLVPAPGSPEELRRFAELQRRLAPLFRRAFPDEQAPQTVVVVPSMSLPESELDKLTGSPHYEERLLCILMLLRRPRTHILYVTSQPLSPCIVDYYLHLLPGVPARHARERLTLLSCHDASAVPLTRKILDRPRLRERIRAAIADPAAAHLTCFNPTALERTLAVQLGIPLYGCDPALAHLGSKSGSREVFRRAGVPLPDGFEHLRDAHDVAAALAALRLRDPALRRAVVKLNEGFSGEGNALFDFAEAPAGAGVERWVRAQLPARLRYEAPLERWETFEEKLRTMGGVAECFLDGAGTRSPSVQCRVDPLGDVSVISTHDQVLGGPSGQVFLGCTFPADAGYRRAIQESGMRVAEVLRREGVIGRFGVDFIARRRGEGWEHAALEINLRKGGTTHPYLLLHFLTDGRYDPETGLFLTPNGQACHYYASDNVQSAAYRGLTPDDLIDIAVGNGLHFHGATQQGVMFHMIGALSQFGKLGTVCIADSPDGARRLYENLVSVLDREARPAPAAAPTAEAPRAERRARRHGWTSGGRRRLRAAAA
ncbi:MAG: peptide ligase PGM1-related protein [Longimicrobiaceae bacterium]